MKTKLIWTGVLLALVAGLLMTACASTPPPAKHHPGEAAEAVVEHLKAGDRAGADRAFAKIASDDDARNLVYTRVYHRAGQHYGKGEYANAAPMLRFLAAHYPEATAPQEALLYSLFLERVGSRRPAPAERWREMEVLVHELRSRKPRPPAGLELVSAQLAVDAGRIEDARASMARFHQSWGGSPEVLRPYVVEMTRYLETH